LLGYGIDRRFGKSPVSVFDEGTAQGAYSGDRRHSKQPPYAKTGFPVHSDLNDRAGIMKQDKQAVSIRLTNSKAQSSYLK
jgi:hypothetical protein